MSMNDRQLDKRSAPNQTPWATDPKMLKNQKKIDEKMLSSSDMIRGSALIESRVWPVNRHPSLAIRFVVVV